MLGNRINLKWEVFDQGFKIIIPEKVRNSPSSKYAWVFKLSGVKSY